MRTEAWIFLAIARASVDQPGTLEGVLNCADHINTMPTPQELEQAVATLSAVNWVHVEGTTFTLLPEGRRVFEQVDAQDPFPRTQPPIVERILDTLQTVAPVNLSWRLSESDFQAALASYNKTMKAAYRSLRRSPMRPNLSLKRTARRRRLRAVRSRPLSLVR